MDDQAGASLRPRWRPAAKLVDLHLADGSRVRVRPSGTEPKLKIEVDLCSTRDPKEAIDVEQGRALVQAKETANDLVTWLALV